MAAEESAAGLTLQIPEIRLHHHADQSFEADARRPPQDPFGFGVVRLERIHLGGAVEERVANHVLTPNPARRKRTPRPRNP